MSEPVDIELLRRLVAPEGGVAHAAADWIEAASRCGLRVVMASALLGEGVALEDAIVEEVEAWAAQIERYRSLHDELRGLRPDIEVQKGFELQDLYPRGWIRDCGDLDVTVRRRADVWECVRWLRARGWDCVGFSLVRCPETIEVVVGLQKAVPEPIVEGRQMVEIASIDFAGNSGTVPVRSCLPGGERPSSPVRHLLALVEEHFERPFGARDALDAQLLMGRLGPGDAERLDALLTTLRLWPEWRHLVATMRRRGLSPTVGSGGGLALAASLGARGARWIVGGLRPARWAVAVADRLTVLREASAAGSRLVWRLHDLVGPAQVLAARLPLYGFPIDAETVSPDLELQRRGGQLLASTPLGTYLMTYGGTVDPRWVEPFQP